MTEVTAPPSDSVPDETAPATAVAAPPKPRPTPAQWAEIETHWEYGTMTGVALSKMYPITTNGLADHFRRHGIHRNSKKALLKKEVEESIVGASVAAEDPAALIWEQKRKPRITQVRNSINSHGMIIAKTINQIGMAISNGTRTPAECANDIKSLRHYSMLLNQHQTTQLRNLGAENDVNESELPVLRIRDLTQEDIDRLASQDIDTDLDFDMPAEPEVMSEEEEVIEEGVSSPLV
jgi:hypothetical protein